MYARIRDTTLYFDVEGPGLVADGPHMIERPVAFVLHGGPGGDHVGLRSVFGPFADQVQLVYLDHRGQGRSARGPQASYTLENNVEDMEALRRYLGLGKIIVIGVSYGGMVALSYAVRYPQHVAACLPIVTTAHGGFLARAQQILAERGTPEQQRVAAPLWDGSFTSEAQLREYYTVMGPLYSVRFDPEAAALNAARTIHSYEALNEGFGGFLRTYDVSAQLGVITAPTLVLGGRQDWICPPELSEEIARGIPNAQLQIFEQSSHRLWADEPEAFQTAVREFLAHVGAGGEANAGQSDRE
jgi:proline iminopeptidase